MAITLRNNEVIKCEVNFHWSAFILVKLWAVLGVLSLLGQLVAFIASGDGQSKHLALLQMPMTIVMFFAPFTYKWLQNKSKVYVVTNERIYVEEGILSKNKMDIPLSKVNDISVSQGLIQRMFGSGNVVVTLGHDKPRVISDIENPDEFKNAVFSASAGVTTKAS